MNLGGAGKIYGALWRDHDRTGKSVFARIRTSGKCEDHWHAVFGFFDFLTNSVMMPIAAIATCLFVSRVVGVKRIEEEVTYGGGTFKRRKVFLFMIQYLCPIFAGIILLSSVANAFGWISM